MTTVSVPTHHIMMNPIIHCLRSLGGSATIEELNTKVMEHMEFSDEQLALLHDPEKGVAAT